MIKKFLQKINFLRHTELIGNNAFTIFDKSAELKLKRKSRIIINNGVLKIGGSLPDSIELPSLNKTHITMEPNSTLIINGDVYIATGTFIHIKKDATMVLNGQNFIGHNNIIICSKEIFIGENTSTSWNVTLIDHDGHKLFAKDGRPLKKPIKSLRINKNVGLQMNVTIPSGVTIGQNSLIGAHSVVREDIPEETFVYDRTDLRRKDGISAGLQFLPRIETPVV